MAKTRRNARRNLDTLAGRLRYAIETRPPVGRQRGLRLFQREMEARAAENDDVRGITTVSIQSYLKGDVTPSLEFLEAAAEVLGVRAEWLAFGSGEKTALAEAATTSSEAKRHAKVLRQLRHELDLLYELPYYIAADLLEFVDQWVMTEGAPTDWLTYANRVWDDLLAPFGGQKPADFVAFADYASAYLHARLLALRVPTFDPESED